MKCSRCGREIPENEKHTYQGKTLCEECYIKAISPEKECDPWATFLSSQERGGSWPKTAENLTELQKSIYEFIKTSSRATRQGIAAKFKLSTEDLESHVNVLMHSELVKERSEGNKMYLIPVPVSRK